MGLLPPSCSPARGPQHAARARSEPCQARRASGHRAGRELCHWSVTGSVFPGMGGQFLTGKKRKRRSSSCSLRLREGSGQSAGDGRRSCNPCPGCRGLRSLCGWRQHVQSTQRFQGRMWGIRGQQLRADLLGPCSLLAMARMGLQMGSRPCRCRM